MLAMWSELWIYSINNRQIEGCCPCKLCKVVDMSSLRCSQVQGCCPCKLCKVVDVLFTNAVKFKNVILAV